MLALLLNLGPIAKAQSDDLEQGIIPSFEAPDFDPSFRSLQNGSDTDRGAEPLSRPLLSSQRKWSGLVTVSYVVRADGTVSDVLLVDSFGRDADRFAAELVQVMQQEWRYRPALWRGERVDEADGVLTVLGYPYTGNGVSRSFARDYEKVSEAAASGNLDEAADRLYDDLLDEVESAFEFGNFALLQANIEGARANEQAQYAALSRALVGSGLTPEQEYRTLQVKLGLETRLGYLAEALSTYGRIESHELYQRGNGNAIDSLAGEIEQRVQQHDAPLIANATVDRSDPAVGYFWRYRLLRRSIRIDGIDGALDRLELRCERRYEVDSVSADKTWEMPDHWGACSAYVFGDRGASFRLIELGSP